MKPTFSMIFHDFPWFSICRVRLANFKNETSMTMAGCWRHWRIWSWKAWQLYWCLLMLLLTDVSCFHAFMVPIRVKLDVFYWMSWVIATIGSLLESRLKFAQRPWPREWATPRACCGGPIPRCAFAHWWRWPHLLCMICGIKSWLEEMSQAFPYAI